jgi:hypothetical protein
MAIGRQDATVSEVKARIRSIAALLAGIKEVNEAPGEKYKPWTDAQLSAVIVRMDGTTARTRETLGYIRITRNYSIYRFVQRVAAKRADYELEAVLAAEAVIDDLPNHFLAYPRLALNDDGIVLTTAPMTDAGAGIVSYGDVDFSVIRYTLPVVTLEAF